MWSIAAIVGVAVGAAACVFAAGVILLRRYYRQKLAETNYVRRKLTDYQRQHLSIDGNNYSQIPRPPTVMRRTSSQRPVNILSEGWTTVPSQEQFAANPVQTILEQSEIDVIVPPAKRRKGFRQTFKYAYSIHPPKSRRQKEYDRAIPVHGMPQSPLSAITEFTDCTPGNSSPIAGVIELPTTITPTDTPEQVRPEIKEPRPLSLQWPIPPVDAKPRNRSGVVQSVAPRGSVLMRMNSTGHSIGPPRPSMGQRSASMASNITLAPEVPLPPLPSLQIPNQSRRRVSALRLSSASVDTVGSSVLGTTMTSPSQANTDYASFSLATRRVDLGSPGLQAFDPSRESCEPSAVMLGGPVGQPAMRGMCNKPGIESFRASTSRRPGPMTEALQYNQVPENSIKRIDASGWDADVPWRSISFRTRLGPSLPTPVNRAKRSVSVLGKRASNPILEHKYHSGSPRQPLKARPASVATGNPVQWDQGPGPAIKCLSYDGSPDHRKGHKRQNCVRISNIPPIDPDRRNSRLPQMTEEEEEDQPTTPRSSAPRISGPELLEDGQGYPALRARPSLVEIKASPSPFHNRPVLEPTSRSRVASYSVTSSRCSSPVPRPDSDVFVNSRDASPHDLFGTTKSSPRQWPLTPTATKNIKLNATLPALRAVEEHYEETSPMLPTPALTSATLFPYRSTIQGPRLQPRSGQPSPSVSPSPAAGRNTQKRTATGDDLRRSVMMLRSTNMEGKFQNAQSRPYRGLSDESLSISSTTGARSPETSLTGVSMALKSPGSMNAHLVVGKQRGSVRASNPYVGNPYAGSNRSKMSMALSPSMMSMGGASVWEDVSVRGSPEPEGPAPLGLHTPRGSFASQNWELVDVEKENLHRNGDDRKGSRLNKTISPQGKGLGLSVNSRVWGTPESLYDEEVFSGSNGLPTS